MIEFEPTVKDGCYDKGEEVDATLFLCEETGVKILRPASNLDTIRDGRGAILTWLPEDMIVEFNIVHFRPSCVRGMHYHEHFVEYSLCVLGHGMFVYRLNRDDPSSERSLNISKGFCVRIPKGVVHTIYSIDELTMVAMLSHQWDKSDPPIVQVDEIPKPFKVS
jgi:mannose-6-phosphate isomerase-like protein (cupin superfamily)